MECRGDGPDHCCYLGSAGVCRFLEVATVPDRRWVCGLRRELGSFDAVHTDPRYLADVRPLLDAAGVVEDCGAWPPPGVRCATCKGCD